MKTLRFALLAALALTAACGSVVTESTGTTATGGSTSSTTTVTTAGDGGTGGYFEDGECEDAQDCTDRPPLPCGEWDCVSYFCQAAPLPAGTEVAEQTPGDCQKLVCGGQSSIAVHSVADDSDVPEAAGVCVLSAGCMGGVPVIEPASADTTCNKTCHCDGAGSCAGGGCPDPNICAPTGNPCLPSKCVGCDETCALVPEPAGTPIPDPKGDCKALVCDGAGMATSVNDDLDIPDDGDPCTVDSCDNGTPQQPPLCPPPQTCNQGICSP